MTLTEAIAFMNEAAIYFETRDTHGEDKAHWSNVYNAQNCRAIIDRLVSSTTPSAGDVKPRGRSIVIADGVARWRANAVCKWAIDRGHLDMNQIAFAGFEKRDMAEFAQLIGYSVSGWGDLSYVSRRAAERADARVEAMCTALKTPPSKQGG